LRFQKGDKLIAPDIEKDVPETSAFLDLYPVGNDRFEAQNTLVELTSLVQAKGRETDMGNPLCLMAITPRVEIDGNSFRTTG
jgi:hypothetical protein